MRATNERTLPDAGRLIGALSHIGYRLEDSLSDLVDNAISAEASDVLIRFEHDGEHIVRVLVVDNGNGMSRTNLREAMRFGSEKSTNPLSLGKFGLGMKLASLSYCDSLAVHSRMNSRSSGRRWTVENISAGWNCEILSAGSAKPPFQCEYAEIDLSDSGTIVCWERLRNFPTHKRGIRSVIGLIERRLRLHLGMRFHRFIESGRLTLKMDQQLVGAASVPYWVEISPLNPFSYFESGSKEYPKKFTAEKSGDSVSIEFEAHIWPPKSDSENYRLGKRASSYQGFFVYRKDRLIQAGGWFGLVNDESEPHSSLARIRMDLPEEAEEAFGLNVQKSMIIPPLGFQDAVRESKSPDGTSWEQFRSDAIRAYRGSEDAEGSQRFYQDSIGLFDSSGKKKKGSGLKTKWSRSKRAPLVELRGDSLVFNRLLRVDGLNLFTSTLFDALVQLIIEILNDPKSRLRAKGGDSLFREDIERQLAWLLERDQTG